MTVVGLTCHRTGVCVCVCVDDSGWSHLSSYVRVPELSFSQFVADCLYDNSLLTLYVCVVHRLSTTPQQQSLAHELDTLNLLTDWTSTARPTYVNYTQLHYYSVQVVCIWSS